MAFLKLSYGCWLALGVLASSLFVSTETAAQAFEASRVRIEGFHGSAHFILTKRSSIRITPRATSHEPLVSVSLENDTVVVRMAVSENAEAIRPRVEIALPISAGLTIIDSDIEINLGAFDGELKIIRSRIKGEAASANRAFLGLTAGSSFFLGDVRTETDIELSGDADLRVNRANLIRALVNDVSGLTVGDVGQLLDVSIGGRSAVSVDKASGVLHAHIKDRGFLVITDGRLNRMQATLDGPGSLTFEGVTGEAELNLDDAATVSLAFVTGRVVRTGKGIVYIGGRRQY